MHFPHQTKDCDGCIEDALLGGAGLCFEHRVQKIAWETKHGPPIEPEPTNCLWTFHAEAPEGLVSLYFATKQEAQQKAKELKRLEPEPCWVGVENHPRFLQESQEWLSKIL